MSSRTQILSAKKTVDATPQALVYPFIAESEKNTYSDYAVFERINQLDQFYTDKKNCKFFRFYGHVNEVVNLKFGDITSRNSSLTSLTVYDLTLVSGGVTASTEIVININGETQVLKFTHGYYLDMIYGSLIAAFDTQVKRGDFAFVWNETFITVEPRAQTVVVTTNQYPLQVRSRKVPYQASSSVVLPKFSDFDLSDRKAWRAYLMAALTLSTGTTENKGDTVCSTTFDTTTRTFDFKKGIPALPIKEEVINNKTRRGMMMYFGHNLKVNDLFHLSNTNKATENGVYRVSYVLGNKVYFQLISLDSSGVNSAASDISVATDDSTTDVMAKIGKDEIELGITTAYYNSLSGRTDVNWLAVIKPHLFVKKLVNKKASEYYLKKLYYIGEMDDIINCGFSNNSYNQQTFNYTKHDKIYLENLKNNLMAPVTEVYVVFVKRVSEDLNMTSVQANFHNFLSSTFDYNGVQTVSDHIDKASEYEIDYTDTNNFLYYGLMEYNPETLLEVEINHIEHTFITNLKDVEENHIRFGFDPFYEVPLRKLSNTIDEVDAYLGAPEYAVYSEKYQTYRWRHLLEIGYFETQGNGIDFPFMNNAFYVFSNILLNIKNYKSTKVPSLLTGGYLISAYTDTLIQEDTENTTDNPQLDDSLLENNKYDKPFTEYTETIC